MFTERVTVDRMCLSDVHMSFFEATESFDMINYESVAVSFSPVRGFIETQLLDWLILSVSYFGMNPNACWVVLNMACADTCCY